MNETERPPIILAVDDEPSNIQIIASNLSPIQPKLLVANNGQTALDILQDNVPDLILLDVNMSEMSGIEVCRQIKALGTHKHIPIIFLTASPEDVSEAFAAGGVDYILKPVKPEELIARVNTHIKINHLVQSLDKTNILLESVNESLDLKVQTRTLELVTANKNLRLEIDERRRLQDNLTYLSTYDFITRMFNRSSMEQELRVILEQVGIDNERWYLIYIDLDQFKVVNDTCGHIAGDELLRQIAEIIRDIYSTNYICARMGGDEFTILLKSESIKEASKKALYIKETIENHKFHWIDEVYRHTISMAVVEIDEGVDSVSHLLSIAERTCFESKSRGGGEISIYNNSPDYIDKAQQQMKVIPIIHQAIEEDQFVLYYQHISPFIPNGEDKVEILIRLKDKNGSVKPPAHFIPVAERFHLIAEIDKWVIKNTLKVMQHVPSNCLASINLSGEFIVKSNAAKIIKDMIDEYQIAPNRLCFEITETSAISNLKATQNLISQIGDLGCLFALDDFGTGTSSYEYLKHLSVDFVKIDGMFIRDIENDEINRKMVESIIGISEAKKVKVIAECVETSQALEILKSMNIDYYQGFYDHRSEPFSNLITH